MGAVSQSEGAVFGAQPFPRPGHHFAFRLGPPRAGTAYAAGEGSISPGQSLRCAFDAGSGSVTFRFQSTGVLGRRRKPELRVLFAPPPAGLP